jgi:hypothetical protein
MRSSALVATAFQDVLGELEPEPSAVEADVARVRRIVRSIENGYEVSRAEIMGSHKKDTAVDGVSDIDLFLLLKRDQARWGKKDVSSETVLTNCRTQIQASLGTSSVRLDKVAVSVGIARATHRIEVVPALFDGFTGSFPRFRIPDGNGDWMPSAPLAHADWLQKAHANGGHRLKPIVRLLKAWAWSREATAPLSSYYVECALGQSNVVGGPWSNAEALRRGFERLAQLACRDLQDPLGVSLGPVRAAGTDQQRTTIKRLIVESCARAVQAREEEDGGRDKAALQRWGQVFNHRWF